MALVEVQKRFRIILPDDQKAERANSAPGKEKKRKKKKSAVSWPFSICKLIKMKI